MLSNYFEQLTTLNSFAPGKNNERLTFDQWNESIISKHLALHQPRVVFTSPNLQNILAHIEVLGFLLNLSTHIYMEKQLLGNVIDFMFSTIIYCEISSFFLTMIFDNFVIIANVCIEVHSFMAESQFNHSRLVFTTVIDCEINHFWPQLNFQHYYICTRTLWIEVYNES